MKKIYFILLAFPILVASCKENSKKEFDSEKEKSTINNTLDKWHEAAANADYTLYFSLMTKDGVFIGTDATENWNNFEFREFSKPYFDNGKAWSFKSLERHIYFSDKGELAWFDELLDTQMGICRGSGVLKTEDNKWKIAHYVLSMTIPNDQVQEIVNKKQVIDQMFIEKLKQND